MTTNEENMNGTTPNTQRWSNKPKVVTYAGREYTLRQLCEAKQISFTTVFGRLKKGWSLNDAVDTPPRLSADAITLHAHGYAKRSTARRSLHVEMAERALGKPLPPGVEVHHVNGIKHDNRPENLVICPDHAYHFLLHARQRAMDACGDPSFRKCEICGEWGNPDQMYQRKKKPGQWHRACGNKARAQRKQRSNDK